MNEFRKGQVIIYKNGDKHELGVVKREGVDKNTYFVNYHMGETASCTHARNMTSIMNEYAFLILRKSVEDYVIPNGIKQLANCITVQLVDSNLINDNMKPHKINKMIYDIIQSFN